jgi:hypothetical protein
MSLTTLRREISTLNSLLTDKSDDKRNYTVLKSTLKKLDNLTYDEYKDLKVQSLVYLNFLFDLNNKLNVARDVSRFKEIIKEAKIPIPISYKKLGNNGLETVNKSANINDLDIFGSVILSVLYQLAANSRLPDKSIYFLPDEGNPSDVNKFTTNINPSNNLITDYTSISSTLKNIASIVDKLKVPTPQTPATTPTAVANSSVKDIDDLIREFNDNIYEQYSKVNKDLFTNYNNFSDPTKESDITKLNNILSNRTNHINLINKYKDDILKFKDTNGTTYYTEEDINKSIQGLKKDISILNELIKKAKGANQDNQVNTSPPPTTETNQTQTPAPTTEENTPTETTKPTETTPQIPQLKELPVDQWGIRFTTKQLEVAANQSPFSTYYMSLLPARQSTVPIQGGRDVPNAMPGLNFKFVPAVGKQQIPGFSPIYQNLGIKGLQVIIVGAFTGADGEEKTIVDDPKTFGSNRFSSTLGGMNIADNPVREPKAELNAYNSYLAFQKLAYEGKQIEVEINTAQVYNTLAASPYAETLKLQDPTSGNPQFTAVIRNLDVYHATQERTWYTLVLDVTNFNMASKENINLNVSLQKAITQAQEDMKNKEGPNQEGTTATEDNPAVVPSAGNDSSTINNLKKASSIIDNINKIENLEQKAKQIECYKHMLKVLQYIQNSDIYVFKNYITGIFKEGFLASFSRLIRTGFYSDIKFQSKGSNVAIVSARVQCTLMPLSTFTVICAYHVYWKIDFDSKTQPITRYTQDDNLGDKLAFLRPDGQAIIDFFKNMTYGKDNCEGTKEEKDNELRGIVGWNKNTLENIAGRLTGCVLGQGIIIGGVAAVTGGTGIIPAAAGIAANCGLQALGESITASQEFNKEEPEFINNLAGSLFVNLILGVGTLGLGGVIGKVTGTGFTTGALQGVGLKPKQGFPISGGSKAVPSTAPTVVNSVDDLLTNLNNISDIENKLLNQTITFKEQEGIIKSLVKNPDGTLNGIAKIEYTNGQTVFIHLKDADSLPDNLLNQPTVTPNSPNSPSTPTQNPSVSKIDESINKRVTSNDLKNYLLGLSEDQKIIALKALDEVTLMDPNQILEVRLKNGTTIVYNSKPTIGSQGNISTNTNDIINVNNIESSSLKPKSTPTPPQQPPTPPQQPTQQPQNPVPQNQTTTPNTPDPNSQPVVQQPGGGVKLTGTALDNYNKLLPFSEKQLAKGKEIVVTLKNGSKIKLEEFKIVELENGELRISYSDFYQSYLRNYSIDFNNIVDIIIPN